MNKVRASRTDEPVRLTPLSDTVQAVLRLEAEVLSKNKEDASTSSCEQASSSPSLSQSIVDQLNVAKALLLLRNNSSGEDEEGASRTAAAAAIDKKETKKTSAATAASSGKGNTRTKDSPDAKLDEDLLMFLQQTSSGVDAIPNASRRKSFLSGRERFLLRGSISAIERKLMSSRRRDEDDDEAAQQREGANNKSSNNRSKDTKKSSADVSAKDDCTSTSAAVAAAPKSTTNSSSSSSQDSEVAAIRKLIADAAASSAKHKQHHHDDHSHNNGGGDDDEEQAKNKQKAKEEQHEEALMQEVQNLVTEMKERALRMRGVVKESDQSLAEHTEKMSKTARGVERATSAVKQAGSVTEGADLGPVGWVVRPLLRLCALVPGIGSTLLVPFIYTLAQFVWIALIIAMTLSTLWLMITAPKPYSSRDGIL